MWRGLGCLRCLDTAPILPEDETACGHHLQCARDASSADPFIQDYNDSFNEAVSWLIGMKGAQEYHKGLRPAQMLASRLNLTQRESCLLNINTVLSISIVMSFQFSIYYHGYEQNVGIRITC